MKVPFVAAAIYAALVASSVPLIAQTSNALVGKWTIEYESGRRIENGEPTPIMGKGALTIVQSGESLVATLAPGPRPDGTVPPPSSVGGRMTQGGAVFVQKQTVQINFNGETSAREITMTWTLQASGNTLTGTLARELPMMEAGPPSPVKGTRVM